MHSSFGQVVPKFALSVAKRNFCGKVDQHYFGLLYPIMLNIFKEKHQRAYHEEKVL